ncbi:methylated-DNA--protein-cysteine methyltransferase [Salipiger pallidus]|uniref:Methylated-DNA--protein-cysteine methyltransferase n=1 Tax=Salipiger pallidus TaxID=1775170 RepID=A0A8J3EG41_9RHOB|nr:methylated-DNA--[protein]-cysteine S-methyltransferase [Salipiger pallidus]GGG68211.1 methylated-DNA--protein-cysteine methyltransferase [Salipiger pallidus]
MTLRWCHHDSPLGPLLLAGMHEALHFLSFPEGDKAFGPAPGWTEDAAPFDEVRRQLDDYFAGARSAFDLPLRPEGTEFREKVWALLATIPYGTTTTYGALARRLDAPGASRAVGAANGANPIPIILPCHRVLGMNGKLTGFGGGLPAKQWLLRHERGYLRQGDSQLLLL